MYFQFDSGEQNAPLICIEILHFAAKCKLKLLDVLAIIEDKWMNNKGEDVSEKMEMTRKIVNKHIWSDYDWRGALYQ